MASSNDNNSNKFTLPLKAPAASGAGLTPLPPSPEVKPAASQLAGIDPISFSLHGNTGVKKDPDPPSRLRSIAKYQAFSPQALACSDPIPASTFSATATLNGESNEDNAGVYLGGSQRRLVAPVRKEATSSLGAVAGAQGVAVFRVSKPHSPLMMLNHATANTTAGGGRPVTSLTFQPNPTTSLYLAAARGSGVLVWDVSGHSLSPLLGRLAMDSMAPPSSGTSTDSGLVTTSLSWKLSTERDGAPLLATTTKHSACIWDLRQPLSASKPSLRFGMSSRTKAVSNQSGISSPYVQVSCSRSSECALMDAAGTIRIFDIRMTDKSRYHTNGLASFTAFMHSGVGVSYMPWKDRTAWVTWGLDDPNSDAVVKVWSSSNPRDTVDASQKTALPEDYWYQDGSPDKSTGNGVMSHRLIAQCSPPYHLSCPRVCPGPVEHSIVTIGVFDDIRSKKGKDGWRADLWKLRPPTADENEANDGTFGMEKLVTFNGGANHDKYIGSALGKDSSIGQLRAAELAITSYNAYSSPSRKKGEDTMHENFSGDNEFGLVLCCLSEKGYVTTHTVPEALPRSILQASDGIGASSPLRGIPGANGNTKVFLEDKDGALSDAARIWGGQGGDGSVRGSTDARSTVEMIRNIHSSPVKEKMSTGISQQGIIPRTADGGMLFEMDVPAVAYGTVTPGGIAGVQVGPVDLTLPNPPLTEEPDNAAADVRDVAAIAERMENIETERIPCPRLCGAVFGPGVGGLAMFNNGDVRKMWFWYDRAAGSTRLSGVPASITAPEQTFSDLGTSVDPASIGKSIKESVLRDCPRTMKDLMEMTSAAKEAQWGEVNETDTANDDQDQSSGDNFFEYMSTGSLSSADSEEQPAEFVGGTGGKGSRLYENYFGNFRRPIAEPRGAGASKSHGDDDQDSRANNTSSHAHNGKVQVVGPSSDTLAPTVHVTHDFDKLALNNQSAYFAREWELGQWQPESSGTTVVNPQSLATQRPYSSDSIMNKGRNAFHTSNRDVEVAALPSYRRLAPSPQRAGQGSRIQSEPIFQVINNNNTPSSTSRNILQIENEPGVHGGVAPVRPNMQESMVFLRKLFSHQQEGNPFPNLMSPPDSPMLHAKSKSSQSLSTMGQQRQGDGKYATRQSMSSIDLAAYGASAKPATFRTQPGVYALNSETFGTGISEDDQKLSQIKEICKHNARVCAKIGDSGKEGVWQLLAQMVDRRLNERPDAFNGWGGKGGGALGVDLVANIMRYYETLGDVQMLATVVCVLSGGRRNQRQQDGSRGHLYLLPTGQDQKYDAYIRKYSDLLYGWGLLVKRAELKKHLVQHVQHSEGMFHDAAAVANKGRSPGIAIVFSCPRCGEEAEFGTNICRSCQDFAFRCSICENGVRGLFTVCDSCGHGGHVSHMKSWFAKHSDCPAGCGCICTFTSHPPRRKTSIDVNASKNRTSNDAAMGLGGPPYVLA